jgi:FkbM family methyltransferase
MLIPMTELQERYGVSIQKVLHVGAHLGEEAVSYDEAGAIFVVWVEANPALLTDLRAALPLNHEVVHALVGSSDGVSRTLNISNNGQSSSVLPFGTHTIVSPEVHYVGTVELTERRLDALALEYSWPNFDFLNMDIQGYELEALRGFVGALQDSTLRYIYTEVNQDPLYEGCCLVGELDSFLLPHGFSRVATRWAGVAPRKPYGVGWGDALYAR